MDSHFSGGLMRYQICVKGSEDSPGQNPGSRQRETRAKARLGHWGMVLGDGA